jgi:hypothetical protein
MRFNAAAVLSTALLAGAAHAQADVNDADATPAVESALVIPTFTVSYSTHQQVTDVWLTRA